MFIDKEPKINEYKNSHSPKKHIQQTVNAYFIILVIFAIFLFFMYLISREDYDLITSWLKSNETIVLGIAIILVVVTMAQTLSTADKMRKNIKAYKEIINDYVNEMNPVFEDLNDVWIITGFSYTKMNKRIHLPDKQYYWFDPKHQSFSFVQVEPTGPYKVDKTITSIPLSKMRHYEVVGDKYYENKISGGGSQGPNYTGAIIGEALFGVAGAVAGGQQKIDPIQSQVILHDEREVKILFDVSESGITEIYLPHTMYEEMKKNWPERSREIVDEITKQKIIHKTASDPEVVFNQKMALLDRLLKDGMITEDEFENKKKKIIDEMI